MSATDADVITIADAYLETALDDPTIATEAPGGVWNEAAEQGTSGRIVRFAYMQGRSAREAFGGMQIINDELIYEILTYLVVMVGEEDRFEDLKAGATRIKQLLHREHSDVTFTQGKVLWSKYLAPFKERTPEGDKWYPQLGGFYEIAVSPNST